MGMVTLSLRGGSIQVLEKESESLSEDERMTRIIITHAFRGYWSSGGEKGTGQLG